jgi:lysophospholipase L1-like esterase
MLKYLIIILMLCVSLNADDKPKSLDTSVNTAIKPREKLERDFYDWYKRHNQIVELTSKNKYDIVFIGDSITHMFGGQPKSNKNVGGKVWDEYYSKRKVLNIGFGWDRTQNVLWRLDNKELDGQIPKVAVVLIGTNNLAGTKNSRVNTAEEIVEGITAVCDRIHDLSPKTNIILLGVLPRKDKKKNVIIKQINMIIPELAKKDYITFLNIGKKLTDESGMPKNELYKDSVHINNAGYKVWAQAMEPILQKLLK